MPESGVYEIAKYIPLKLRRQMVARVYDRRGTALGALWPARVCAEGLCPLGLLTAHKTPGPQLIARALHRRGLAAARKVSTGTLAGLAYRFTNDWDGGTIRDLHKALGVPK